MHSENKDITVNKLSQFLLDVMTRKRCPLLPDDFASIDSVQDLYLHIVSLRNFLSAAANGDFSSEVLFKGYIGGTLKTLQANLKHVTWQTKMVASGDFSQRVDFMGEFSQSFNTMVIELDRILSELVKKESELNRLNEELLKEISIRKQAEATILEREEALRVLAITDSLTGLYNKRHFNDTAKDEIERAMRYTYPLSIVIFDIDFFKRINDALGHLIGDKVLKRFADIIKSGIRASDILARYGGEEFIILLPETPVEETHVLIERVRKRIEATTFEVEKCSIRITASFGIDGLLLKKKPQQKPEQILSEMVANADHAMYASKHAGRNKTTIYVHGKH